MIENKKFEVGDDVIVSSRYGKVIGVVKRLTKTQMTVETAHDTQRYMLSTLRKVGSSVWDTAYVETATPEKIASVKAANEHKILAYNLAHFNWKALSLAKLREAYAVVIKKGKDE